MEHVLFKENIRFEKIVNDLNQKIDNYKEEYVIDKTKGKYSLIEQLSKMNKERTAHTIDSKLYIDIINTALLDDTPIEYLKLFVKKIVEYKLIDDFIDAVVKNKKRKTICANLENEKYLADAIIIFGDYFLFIECNVEKARKCYSLINRELFHYESICKNENLYENIEKNREYVFLEYIKENNINNEKIKDSLYFFKNNNDRLELLEYVNYTNIIFEYYFPMRKKVENKEKARYLFCEILSIINIVLIRNVYSIYKYNNILSTEEKENIIFLSSIAKNELSDFQIFIKKDNAIEKNLNIILNIVNTIMIIEEIKKDLLVPKNRRINLSYYTSINSFSYMLPYKNKHNKVGYLPLLNISYMNDPTEGTVLYKFLNKENYKNERKYAPFPLTFIKSFTSSIDFLPMWEMYGDKARGLCIVLDWNKMKNNVDLYKICYIKIKKDKKHKIIVNHNDIDNIKRIKNNLIEIEKIRSSFNGKIVDVYDKLLNNISYLFKDDHYHTEDEYRIIQSDNEINSSILLSYYENINIKEAPFLLKYADFIPYIKEIIIGPKYEDVDFNFPFIKSQIAVMCKKLDIKMPIITYSDIDYR